MKLTAKLLKKLIKEEYNKINEEADGYEAPMLMAPLGMMMALVGFGLYGSSSSPDKMEQNSAQVSQAIERMPQEDIYRILQGVRIKNKPLPEYVIKAASMEISQMNAEEIETMILEDSDFKYDFYSVSYEPSEELKIQRGDSIYKEHLRGKRNG